MERRVEDRDLRNGGEGAAGGPDARRRGGIVQRGEGGELVDRREHVVVDDGRRGEPVPAVHDAMTDRGDVTRVAEHVPQLLDHRRDGRARVVDPFLHAVAQPATRRGLQQPVLHGRRSGVQNEDQRWHGVQASVARRRPAPGGPAPATDDPGAAPASGLPSAPTTSPGRRRPGPPGNGARPSSSSRERLLDVPAPLVQLGAPVRDLVEQVAQLALLAGLLVVHVDDPADLVEVEAEALPAQHQRQPDPLARVVDPPGAVPLRREQASVLVEADGPMGHAELVGELGDRPGPISGRPLAVRRGSAGRPAPVGVRFCHACAPASSALP